MPIKYKKTVAVFEGNCDIEEAEGLLSWFLEHPKGKINLKQLLHFHTAILQVIMTVNPVVSAWPEDTTCTEWLKRILYSNYET